MVKTSVGGGGVGTWGVRTWEAGAEEVGTLWGGRDDGSGWGGGGGNDVGGEERAEASAYGFSHGPTYYYRSMGFPHRVDVILN